VSHQEELGFELAPRGLHREQLLNIIYCDVAKLDVFLEWLNTDAAAL
jgi:hypothetical protein